MISIAEKSNLFHMFPLLWLLNKPAILLLFEELPLAASTRLWEWNLCIRCVLGAKLAKNCATVLALNRASFLAPRAAYWRFFQYAALGAKSLWSMCPWSYQISYEGLGRLTCHSSFFGFLDLNFTDGISFICCYLLHAYSLCNPFNLCTDRLSQEVIVMSQHVQLCEK